MCPQNFYFDLIAWLRQMCNLKPLLKVPDNIEVSLRQKDDAKVFFLLNHQSQPIRVQFYEPMHDLLAAANIVGSHDLPPNGVLVLGERPGAST
jgi:beta-galactosidase GanA